MLRTIPDVGPECPDEHLAGMAATARLPHDHNADWVDELERVAAASHALPGAAVRAVLATIEAFAAEDAVLPQPASNTRSALAATLDVTPSVVTLSEALHVALKLSVRREPSYEPAHAV